MTIRFGNAVPNCDYDSFVKLLPQAPPIRRNLVRTFTSDDVYPDALDIPPVAIKDQTGLIRFSGRVRCVDSNAMRRGDSTRLEGELREAINKIVRASTRTDPLEVTFEPGRGPDDWTCQLFAMAAHVAALLIEVVEPVEPRDSRAPPGNRTRCGHRFHRAPGRSDRSTTALRFW